MLCYCAHLKAIRYESTSLNRIVADKSHCVIVAYEKSRCFNVRFNMGQNKGISYVSCKHKTSCFVTRGPRNQEKSLTSLKFASVASHV